MSRYIDVDEVNSIVGSALEEVKDEISSSYYRGARYILDRINEMADRKTEPQTDCKECKYAWWNSGTKRYECSLGRCQYEDEPQTERSE